MMRLATSSDVRTGCRCRFPVWMTDSSAAEIEITHAPRPALTALLELRRLTTTCLSSLGGNESDGGRDAPTSDRARTTIRRQQRGSRAPATEGGSSASGRCTDKLVESTREDNRGG